MAVLPSSSLSLSLSNHTPPFHTPSKTHFPFSLPNKTHLAFPLSTTTQTPSSGGDRCVSVNVKKKPGCNVQAEVEEDDHLDFVMGQFERDCVRFGIFHEIRRRKRHENAQDKRERKFQESSRRRYLRKRAVFTPRAPRPEMRDGPEEDVFDKLARGALDGGESEDDWSDGELPTIERKKVNMYEENYDE